MPPTCPHGSYNLAHCMTQDEARAAGGRWARATLHLGRNGAMRAVDEAVALATGELVLARGETPQEIPAAMREEIDEVIAYKLRQAAALEATRQQLFQPKLWRRP